MHPAAWCGPATLDNVEILESVHRDYISSGADIITTNTYASSRLMLAPAGCGDRFEEINRAAVTAAHEAREMSGRADVLVAGSLSHMCPIAAGTDRADADREPPAAVMRESFLELAMLLRESGCDLIFYCSDSSSSWTDTDTCDIGGTFEHDMALVRGEISDCYVAALEANQVDVTSRSRPGLGHGIDPEGMASGAEFLARALVD